MSLNDTLINVLSVNQLSNVSQDPAVISEIVDWSLKREITVLAPSETAPIQSRRASSQALSARKIQINNIVTDNDRKGTFVSVLGAGGVGGCMANTILSRPFLMGDCLRPDRNTYEFIDYDVVEPHNLNRSSYLELDSVGSLKIEAIGRSRKFRIINRLSYSRVTSQCNPENTNMNLFNEARSKSNLFLRCEKVQNVDDLKNHLSHTRVPRNRFIIDCRDTLNSEVILEDTWVKLAYDGGNDLAFHFNPKEYVGKLLNTGDGGNYDVVPSFYVPANILANTSLFFSIFRPLKINKKGMEVRMELDDLIENSGVDIDDICELYLDEELEILTDA